MDEFVVTNLEDDVRDKLREMARLHGQSMEETVRDILRRAVLCKPKKLEGFGTRSAKLFKDCGLLPGEEIAELRGHYAQPADFSKHYLEESSDDHS